MGRMVERFLFLLQAFAPSALRMDVYEMYFSLFFVCLSILDHILMISDDFLTFLDHFLTFPDKFLNPKILKGTQKYSKVPKTTQKY